MTVAAATFAEVLDAVREQTALLLGTTIPFDEEDWATPARLRGWTRSHIAAHLVEGALSMSRLLATGGREGLVPLPQRRLRLERWALTPGLELQIQLDEASGALQHALSELEGDSRPMPVAFGWSTLAQNLPLVRLREVVLHHHDLAGERPIDLPTPVVIDLLRLERDRPRAVPLPPVLLVSDEGYSTRIGLTDEDVTTVIGPVLDLFLWVARGVVAPSLSGAGDPPAPEPEPAGH